MGDQPVLPSRAVEADAGVAEEDTLRARFYALLARLLAEPPSDATMASLRALEGDDTEIGRSLTALRAVAAKTSVEQAEEEFGALFVGTGTEAELLPYASYYLTGFLYERPLAQLRGRLAELGIERSGRGREPEDHIAFLCEVMHGLIVGSFGKGAGTEVQREFFRAHILPWAGRFFQDLEKSKSAVLYMPVATIGRLFVGVEEEAFEMAA
jgi:TorA maturation chaperone TorD